MPQGKWNKSETKKLNHGYKEAYITDGKTSQQSRY